MMPAPIPARPAKLRGLRWAILGGLWLAGFVTPLFGDAPDWENEQVLHINTEAPRASFTPFATVEQALNGSAPDSPFYRTLDGPWKFHWAPRPE